MTKKGLTKAAKLRLDLDWFADNFLTATAWKAYQEAIDTAGEACEKAKAKALWNIIKEYEL